MARALLKAAIRAPDPVLFLEPMRLYREGREPVPRAQEVFALGCAQVVRPGADVTIVSYGAMLHESLRAAEVLADAHGMQAEVIDLVTLSPLDLAPLVASYARTGHLVVVHESPRCGGLGAEILAALHERMGAGFGGKMCRVCGWDVPYPFPGREHHYLPDAARIIDAVCAM